MSRKFSRWHYVFLLVIVFCALLAVVVMVPPKDRLVPAVVLAGYCFYVSVGFVCIVDGKS